MNEVRKAWVLKEINSDRYFTRSRYDMSNSYFKDVASAIFMDSLESAERVKKAMNNVEGEKYRVVPIEIRVMDNSVR